MRTIIRPAGIGRRVLLRGVGIGSAMAVAMPAVLRAQTQQAATQHPSPAVRIDNFTFAPTPLTVVTGATVTWTNDDDIPHSIYCPALNLRSSALDTGEHFAHRFDQPGRFDYMCGIHPHMRGQIIVQE